MVLAGTKRVRAFEAVGVTMVGVQPEFWPIHNVMMGTSQPLATSTA